MARLQTVRGTRDILPGEIGTWHRIESLIREMFSRYGFREIRTPIFEATELFARGVGSSTDIVRKEMYTFQSGEDSVTLRPEMTASVVRAFIQHGLARVPGADRLYYVGPMFRRERPQRGRQRQFHQIGVEVLGQKDAYIDAETIEMVMTFLRTLGEGSPWPRALRLVINSVGCHNEDCRPRYRRALRAWLEPELPSLCEDCHRRAEENPLRVFDCKVPADQKRIAGAPTLNSPDPDNPSQTYRCSECEEHLAALQGHLQTLGYGFEQEGGYWIDDRLVRGLDYYVRTAFEVYSDTGLGSQNSLLGGGRYDGLVKELGGPDLPGFGWAMGIERLILLVDQGRAEPESPRIDASSDLFVVHLGPEAFRRAIVAARELRARALSVRIDPRPARLDKQMQIANREGARFALIIGEAEIQSGRYQLKDMASSRQEPVPADDWATIEERVSHAGKN